MQTPEPTGQPAAPAPYADAGQLDESGTSHIRTLAWGLGLLVFISFGDLFLIKSTISRVFAEMVQYQAWVLSIGLTLASLALMIRAGMIWRASGRGRSRVGVPVVVVVLMLGWALLGAGLFWLRWNAAAFTPEEVNLGGGAAATNGASREEAEQMLAVVLAAVYLVTGVLAWVDGYLLGNPAAKAMRRAKRDLGRLEQQVAEKSGRVQRLADTLQMHQDQFEALEAERRQALQARADLAAELKDYARVQLAMNLGDVRATGLVRNRPQATEQGEGGSNG